MRYQIWVLLLFTSIAAAFADGKDKKPETDKKKKAEQVLRRAKRHGDVNNPSNEEVDAAQELEQMTWQDR